MGKTLVTLSVFYVKFRALDLFQPDKASAELHWEGKPADCKAKFKNEASWEEYLECPCFKCFMQNEVGRKRVGVCNF